MTPRRFLQQGFTLIELLVVMAIIAIIFTMTLPNITENSARQRMLSSSALITTAIRNAQSNVLTGEVYGQQVKSGIHVDIIKDTDEVAPPDAYGIINIFINRDGDTPDKAFFDEFDTSNTCSSFLPTAICSYSCTQCLQNPANCGPLNAAQCSDFMQRDYLIQAIKMGTLAGKDVEGNNVTLGKIRVLRQDGLEFLDNPARVLIAFMSPKADASLLVQDQFETTPDAGYFTLCMEVKARISRQNQGGFLSRTLVFDRVGGFIREYARWPLVECGAYN